MFLMNWFSSQLFSPEWPDSRPPSWWPHWSPSRNLGDTLQSPWWHQGEQEIITISVALILQGQQMESINCSGTLKKNRISCTVDMTYTQQNTILNYKYIDTINTWHERFTSDVCLDFVMCLWLCPFAFQESVRKAADLTLKTLSKVSLFVTILACVLIPVCLYMCTSKYLTVSFPLCPGVHSYVWVNRLCSSENCGGDVTNPAGKRHCQQCVRGPLTKVTANF